MSDTVPLATQANMPLAGLSPDPQDSRDVDMLQNPQIRQLAQKSGGLLHQLGVQGGVARPLTAMAAVAPPAAISLRAQCGPVEDQGSLNACTAHAAVALMNLVEATLNKRAFVGSRMFLYKVSRSLLHMTGDSGAYLRTAAGALALFGLPPEAYWAYDPSLLDVEPTGFCYQLGQQYRASSYFRIDSTGISPQAVITRIKGLLQQGLPAMIGYTVYFGAEFQAHASGGIPLPLATDLKVGGHALMICGYDDAKVITNSSTGGATSTGAFEIQNSRGVGWGEQGFGWLPYDYVLNGLATDVWSVINMNWVDLQPFSKSPDGAPSNASATAPPSGA
ncbi:hypothetical protein BH10PSE4_BH10PSE4_03370 [soil metagenome]